MARGVLDTRAADLDQPLAEGWRTPPLRALCLADCARTASINQYGMFSVEREPQPDWPSRCDTHAGPTPAGLVQLGSGFSISRCPA